MCQDLHTLEVILPFKALGGQRCLRGPWLPRKMLGRGQYAANAALARGASGCPASTQNTGGLKSGSHVSASLNNLPPTMGICHFGCQQQRGDQAYRQRTHGYRSIHESYPSSHNGRFLAAGRRLRQTCLGSNADKGQCAHVGESEVHFARLNKALKQLFFSPIANVIVPFLRIYRYSSSVGAFEWPLFLFSPLLYVASIGERWRSPPH